MYRQSLREALCVSARIETLDGSRKIDGFVASIWDVGARVIMECIAPKEFRLVVPSKNKSYLCATIDQRGDYVGVMFVDGS
jgi:hypothetical protein